MISQKLIDWSAADTWECGVGLAVLTRICAGDRYQMGPIGGDSFRLVYDHGSGDRLTVWFGPPGLLMVGFDHEAPVSPYATGSIWPGVYTGLPEAMKVWVQEPADEDSDCFPAEDGQEYQETTFALWRPKGAKKWQCGPVKPYPEKHPSPDGTWLINVYGLAHWNDEKGFPEKQLSPFFDGKPVSDEDIRAINPQANLPAVRALMDQLLYGRKPTWI